MNIVLVHGAWHGGWCWDRVVPLLEQDGHRVVAVTLTGCGERAAEATPELSLDAHVDDVIAAVDASPDDEPSLLVGHSYGGMVMAGVAEARFERLSGLVYLDAFCPEDGESAFTFIPEEYQGWFRQLAAESGDGWRLPASDQLLDLWGLHDTSDRRWVRAQLTDWPLRCFEATARAPGRRFASLPRTYLAGRGDDYPLRPLFEPVTERLRAEGCRCVELDTGHELMIEAPGRVAELVVSAGR